MSHRKPLQLALLLSLGIALLLSGESMAEPRSGGRIVVAVDREPASLNPLRLGSPTDIMVLSAIHHGLVRLDADQNWQPGIAESWEIDDEKSTVRFRLRDDLRWSDGEPLRAEDLRLSFELAMDERAQFTQRATLASIQSVSVPDTSTIVFQFESLGSDPLASLVLNPLPAHRVRGLDPATIDSWDINRDPLGVGFYRLVSWKPGQSVVLERNPHRPAPVALLDEVELRVIPDRNTQVLQLELGEIDIVPAVPLDQVERLQSAAVRLDPVRGRRMNFLLFNCARSPFDDPRMRRALTAAVDRQGFVDQVLFGFGEAAASPVPPVFWQHDASLHVGPRDLSALQDLIAELGGEFEFELITRAGDPIREALATWVQANLAEAGIEIRVRPLDPAAQAEAMRGGEFELMIGQVSAAANGDLSPFFASTSPYNFGGFADENVDRLLEQIRETEDREELRAHYHAVQALLAELSPWGMLYYPHSVAGVNPRLTGGPNWLGTLDRVETWWLSGSQ